MEDEYLYKPDIDNPNGLSPIPKGHHKQKHKFHKNNKMCDVPCHVNKHNPPK